MRVQRNLGDPTGIKMTEIVKESFSTLFSNKTVLILAVTAGILSAILSFFLPTSPNSLTSAGLAASPGLGLGGVVAAIVLSLVIAFVSASMISAVATKSDIGGAVRNGSSRYLWFLGTEIVVGIIFVVPVLLIVVPLLLLALPAILSVNGILPVALGGVLAIIGLILTIFLLVRLIIAPVEAVVGGKGPIESIRSSWNATKGSFFSISGVLFAMGITVQVISGIATAVFSAVGVPAIGALIGTVFGSSLTVATVLIYNALGGMVPAMAKK
jgi:hypothetical protein